MDSSADNRPENHERDTRELESAIDVQTRRRIRSLRGEQRSVLSWVGMFGLVGWSVALPTLLGTALGIYIDRRWSSSYSWTLTLLFAGLFLGCLTAWRWLRSESQGTPGSAPTGAATKDKKP